MKGIIVLDEIPKNCSKCMFNTGLNVCKIMKYIKAEKTVSIYTTDKQVLEKTKPDWCPIKAMPEKLNYKGAESINGLTINEKVIQAIDEAAKLGWDSCIDAIIAEK